jgi:hypothetical protein
MAEGMLADTILRFPREHKGILISHTHPPPLACGSTPPGRVKHCALLVPDKPRRSRSQLKKGSFGRLCLLPPPGGLAA